MARVYGIVSHLDRKDGYILRLFRSTLEGALEAERSTAVAIRDLGWDKGEVSVVSFESDGLSGFEQFRNLAGASEGEVSIILRRREIRDLDIVTISPSRRIDKVLDA